MRVGLIGAGRIAPFYLSALQAVTGVDLSIGASLHSSRARKLANEYEARYFADSYELIDASEYVIVACQTEHIRTYVEYADRRKKFILAEKPLFASHEEEMELQNPDRLMVAYNRRFYRSVAALKERLDALPRGQLIQLSIPERWGSESEGLFFPLRSNGVHAIDLASYLVGRIVDYSIDKFTNRSQLICRFEGERHNAILTFSMNGKVTSAVQVNDGEATYVLSPIERFQKYKRVDVFEASAGEVPIREYRPISDSQSEVDDRKSRQKPGFVEQLNQFLGKSATVIDTPNQFECQQYLQIISELIASRD